MRLGVDIGGTFTDLVLVGESGVLATHKTLTRPDNPVAAILDGIATVLTQASQEPGGMTDVVHGTTLVTNAIIEGKVAKTALLTTKGFRDTIEIGRERRYDIYDIMLEAPPVVVPRDMRFEVEERMTAWGTVRQTLDIEGLETVARAIPADTTALAICFLHSYQSPDHERLARDRLQKLLPGVSISISSDVAPEIREFERMTTTAVNASVQPIVKPYLSAMKQRLRDAGVDANLYIFLSNGGLITADDASLFPVRIAESGPAAGVVGSAFLARIIREDRMVALDMGGTTAKICFVEDGRPHIGSSLEVARAYRFRPGSGIPLKIPSVDLIEIGAGGGSIAHVGNLGLLEVGPRSAGAVPGPVAYGRGGEEPTVTDANLVLGYLDPGYFLGGRMKLDDAAAADTVERKIASPLGLSVEEAAWGIHRVVNENMANAMRIHSAERGRDAMRYTLLASGGAAGVHACHVAESIGITRVVCPANASVFSALGMLSAPVSFDFVRTARYDLNEVDWANVRDFVDSLKTTGREMLMEAGVDEDVIDFALRCELRYVGQGNEIEVAIEVPLEAASVGDIQARFEGLYRERFGRIPDHVRIETFNWRLRVFGPDPHLDVRLEGRSAPQAPVKKAARGAYFPATGRREVDVYDRLAIAAGQDISGPAIIEEIDTTVLVPPGWEAKMLQDQTLIIERRQ